MELNANCEASLSKFYFSFGIQFTWSFKLLSKVNVLRVVAHVYADYVSIREIVHRGFVDDFATHTKCILHSQFRRNSWSEFFCLSIFHSLVKLLKHTDLVLIPALNTLFPFFASKDKFRLVLCSYFWFLFFYIFGFFWVICLKFLRIWSDNAVACLFVELRKGLGQLLWFCQTFANGCLRTNHPRRGCGKYLKIG